VRKTDDKNLLICHQLTRFFRAGTSHDDPIDHYFYETCIADGYRILGMGVATHVNVRYKEMSKTFK